MPISISLPAPSIAWTSKFFSPLIAAGNVDSTLIPGLGAVVAPFQAVGIRGSQARGSWLNAANGAAAQSFFPYGSSAVATAIRYNNRNGRVAARTATTANGFAGNYYMPGEWLPDLRGSAAAVVPGSYQDPESIVGVFDVHVSTDFGAGPPPVGWINDTLGFYFCPYIAGLDARQDLPTGLSISGGFGVFYNDIGGVSTELQYVAWDNLGNILERVPIGAPIITDLDLWNSVRFVIIGAGPGRGATLTVEANGQPVVPVRTFDTAQLFAPAGATGVANSTGLAFGCGWLGAAAGKPQLFCQWDAKFGRFTPGGQQLQGE